mgnify:FL=1
MIVCSEELIDRVLTAATNVHAILGPGLLESVYEAALAIELDEMGISYERQVPINAEFKGHDLGLGFRADMIVKKSLLLELKAVKKVTDLDLAKTITYLDQLKIKRGFMLNFHSKKLKDGIKRVSI